MFDEALKFLFYRKDYKDLLKRIQVNYEKEKECVKLGLKCLLAKKFAGKATSTYEEIESMSNSSETSSKNMTEGQLENHKAFMNYWMEKYYKYCKLINSA